MLPDAYVIVISLVLLLLRLFFSNILTFKFDEDLGDSNLVYHDLHIVGNNLFNQIFVLEKFGIIIYFFYPVNFF